MNWLILHNDNLSFDFIDNLKNEGQTVFKLDITPANQCSPNYVFDGELHSLLSDCFQNKNTFDIIFIPYNLSKENHLEFTGIRATLHIRLTQEWKNNTTPIVFYGCDPLDQVAKISKYPKMLFSKGSYHIFNENIQKFKNIARQVERLDQASWIDLVLNLDLTPPVKYRTHHDIANEYALYKWSKDLGCLDAIPSLKYQFGTRPYFKLLELKDEVENRSQDEKKISSTLSCESQTNILLIDDQANEGWAHFYASLFSKQPKIKFRVFDIIDSKGDIKNIRQESQPSVMKKVIEFLTNMPEDEQPDIILLDLRLCSIDFNSESKPRDLTGIKLVEKIREQFNKGIQIIITSASDKIWNYIELSEKGINGYIIKSTTNQFEYHPITSITQLINKLIPRAAYLKSIFELFAFVKANYKDLINQNEETFEANLDVAFELTLSSFDNQKNLNFAYLILYQLFETFLKSENIFKEEPERTIIYNDDLGIVFRKLIQEDLYFDEKKFDDIVANLSLLNESLEGEEKEKNNERIERYNELKNLNEGDYSLWHCPMKIELTEKKVVLSFDRNRIVKESPKFSLDKSVSKKAVFVLAYRYGADKNKIKEFNNIRIIRNKKTAHGEKKQELVTYEEAMEFWEFLKFLFDPKSTKRNYQDYEIEVVSNSREEPQMKTMEKIDLEALKRKFNSRS